MSDNPLLWYTLAYFLIGFIAGVLNARRYCTDRQDALLCVTVYTLLGVPGLLTRLIVDSIRRWRRPVSLLVAVLALCQCSFAAEMVFPLDGSPRAATSGRFLTLDASGVTDGTYSLVISVNGGQATVHGIAPVVTLSGNVPPGGPPITPDPDDPGGESPGNPPIPNPNDRNDLHFAQWVRDHEELVPSGTKNRIVIAKGLAAAYESTGELINTGKITTIEQLNTAQADLNAAIIKTFGLPADWAAFGNALNAELQKRSAAGKLSTIEAHWSTWGGISDGFGYWGDNAALGADFAALLTQILQLILKLILERFGGQ